jgi:hypothetical protein
MNRIALAASALLAVFVMALTSVAAQKNKLLPNVTVKSVTASTLVVTASDKDVTLTIDAKTRVVGKGVGTKTAEMKGKAQITDLIAVGDKVSVTYQEMGATLHASKVEKVAPMK